MPWERPKKEQKEKKKKKGVCVCVCVCITGSLYLHVTRNHEVVGWIPGLAQWIKDPA